jgi:hypothetical protein
MFFFRLEAWSLEEASFMLMIVKSWIENTRAIFILMVVSVIVLFCATFPTGDVIASSATAHANGTLINLNGTYYVITNTMLAGITNPGILATLGYSFSDAVTATAADAALPKSGTNISPADGSLVKTALDQTVYLIADQERHGFTSSAVFSSQRYKYSSIVSVTAPELNVLPLGGVISAGSARHLRGTDIDAAGTVYWLDDTSRHPYASVSDYNSWHIANDFSTVVQANAADLSLPITASVLPRLKNGNSFTTPAPATPPPTANTYNVTTYGAKGDGVTDDGPAIERTLVAAAAGGGGTVTFPCGEFSIQSASGAAPGGRSLLYLKNAKNLELEGQGNCTHVYTSMPQKTVLEFEDSSAIQVSSMRITALNAVYVETYGLDGGSAIRFSGVNDGTISHVEVDGSSAGGLYFTKGTSNSTMSDNYIHDTYGSGIWEDDCGGASASSCAPNQPPVSNVYESNVLTDTAFAMSTAMTLDDGGASSKAIVQNNVISWTATKAGSSTQTFCIQVSNVSDVNIVGNSCTAAPHDGIVVTVDSGNQSNNVVLQGNTITSPGTSSSGGSGIVIYSDPTGVGISNFTISNNIISKAANDGIEIHSGGSVGGVHNGKLMNNTISFVDQRMPGSSFGISIEDSASIVAMGNTISADGKSIAAGINIDQSTGSTPSISDNTVIDILGMPLQVQ